MEFLKGSLTQNKSIETHDAIIERRQEDHTRISIILPYASLGDLSQFLVDGSSDVSQPPTEFYDFQQKFPRVEEIGIELDLSLLKQSAQLADALKFLHEGFRTVADDWKVFCAHMDLKPANIIICQSSDGIVGKWKLCDFGISVFYAEQKGLRGKVGSIGDYFNKVLKTTQRSPRRPPGTFTAPEVEFLASSDNDDPLSSDIWSFGAIFAEILAYSSGRSASVKRFRQMRTQKTCMRRYPDDFFYTWMPENIHHTSYSGYILRGEVSDWLDEFAVDIPPSSPPAACHKCWATCVKSILEAQPKKRPKAAELDHLIDSLYKHTADPRENTCITTFTNRLKADTATHSLSSAHESLGSIFSTPQDQTPSTTLNLVDSHTSSSSENQPRTERKPRMLFRDNIIKPIISPYALGSSGGPRRPSNEQLSQVTPLELTSTDVIDYDLDGYKMAFLCKGDFRVFQLSPMKHAMSFINHEAIPLVEKEQNWKGISIAGDYLVVWGIVSNVPVLRVYGISDDPVQLQGPGTPPYFNPKKRVAISRQGYVAMIHNNFIHIIRASDQTPYRRIEMPRQGKFRNFLGVCFDNAGSILYAWGNQDSIYGALFVYDFTRDQDPEVPIFNGKYQDDFNGKDVVIMPFHGQNDCMIAVGPRFFIACVDRDRREHVLRRTFTQARQKLNEQGLMPQHMFGPFPGPDTVAACIFEGSLILVQSTRSGLFASSKNWTGRICQQLLDPHEMPDMAALRQVANLRERPKTEQKAGIDITVKVRVIQLNETDIFIIVCHKEGKVELVPLIRESQDTY
ncbi:Cyclin-dependent kinase 7 [Cytospora mali]|uniref:non-specific serine/threonine protein kinase n=1 Tax=Cytospora mali TaxID=578113 RepID=A0A194WAB0_CYTMA|nr:Cyclin-dependent kinase 7 [Valsa mali]